ncbi:protein-disulfide reductase DsbD domain-containing protein [Roseovarius dicentrarchi]|uniref:protein-disulfide reductase DsbD domain-containing protein n=1 Tax=Roseovarius dicentrarchi TaxID=2250573 RepID=UPI000DE92291|nr:protein-disulfide reductase DsbD domain-containing protein [Roseovarius dicentrarchi]
MKHILLSLAAALTLGTAAMAQNMDALTSARLLPGWRMADGTHMAAVELRLAPGWKTYWRAPGDLGIPPRFDWRGSGNLAGVDIRWPTPRRIQQGDDITIGYHDILVLPLHVMAKDPRKDIDLTGTVDLGVCRDVCMPLTLSLSANLPNGAAQRDGRIAAALTDRPLTASEAGASAVSCTISPGKDGQLTLRAEMTLPPVGGSESAVIEAGDPNLWIAEPALTRQGNTLIAQTRVAHVGGRAFALDRSELRLTIVGAQQAVDIQGCPAK